MANRAYLLAVADRNITWPKDPESEILAEGIAEIPVFWASLFSADDRNVDTYKGEGGEYRIANWCVSAAAGKQRLRGLQAPIAKLLDEMSQQVWKSWIDHLSAQDVRFFKTSAAEIWSLDPKGYARYLATLLRAFTHPSAPTMKAALKRNGLKYSKCVVDWEDTEETICKLAGADHIRDVPWLHINAIATSDDAATAGSTLGPSLWDNYMAFQKTTGMPYEAAELVLVATFEQQGPAVAPQELLQDILHYFEEGQIEGAERAEELAKRKINSVLDVLRVVEGLRNVGFNISLTSYDPNEFLRAPAGKRLFAGSAG